MYIKKLEAWNLTNWENFFIVNKINKAYQWVVKEVLTSETKKELEEGFYLLKEVLIINWVWPWYLPWLARKILTKLFKNVKSEYHDIMSSIGWTEEDRKKADLWLLYYSLKWNETNFFAVITIYFCFIIVHYLGGNSFNYN